MPHLGNVFHGPVSAILNYRYLRDASSIYHQMNGLSSTI